MATKTRNPSAACRKDYGSDHEWRHMRRDFKEDVNAGRMIVSELREEVARLRIVNEHLRFTMRATALSSEARMLDWEAAPLEMYEWPDPSNPCRLTDEKIDEDKPENPTRKTYEKLDIGDILIYDCGSGGGQTKYMVIATPTSKKQGRHLLFKDMWSVLCVDEYSTHKRQGFIYQAHNSDFPDVELVDYDIIETGAIKKVKEVSVGEAFIHADNGAVYMICELQSTTLAVTFDGRAALVASELNADDSVSMVKLEMTRREREGVF